LVFLAAGTTTERYVRWRFGCPGVECATQAEGTGTQPQPVDGIRIGESNKPRFPVCFYALPLPSLLKVSSQNPDDMLWKMEMHAFATLTMLRLLLLHELSTLIYSVLVVPQTLGFAFWNSSCKKSMLGKGIRNLCHVLQALLFPIVFLFLLCMSTALSLYWWWPDQGWLSHDPVKFHLPAQVPLPPWTFWLAQAALFIETSAVVELVAKSNKVGYNPVRGFVGIVLQLLGLITGHSIFWRCTDTFLGAYVRCCYKHRRTCLCFGEVGLAVGVVAFITWPMCLPKFLLHHGDSLGKVLMWWIGASVLSCVLLFHAIRITKKFWVAVPTTSAGDGRTVDLEAGGPAPRRDLVQQVSIQAQ